MKERIDRSKFKTLDFEAKWQILETKAGDGSLTIEGFANTIDKDRVGDVVLPVAFKKSLPTYQENPVLLYQHDWDKVIGVVTEAQIQDQGLYIKAKISNAKDVDDIRTKIREGVLQTLSIGYNEIDSTINEQSQTKIVKELDLLEISVVTIPANSKAKFRPVENQPEEEIPAETPQENQKSSGIRKVLSDVVARIIEDEHMLPEVMSLLASIQSKKGERAMAQKMEQPGTQGSNPPPPGDKPNDGAADQKPAAGDDHAQKVVSLLEQVVGALKEVQAALQALKPAEAAKSEPPADEKKSGEADLLEAEKSEDSSQPKKSVEEMTDEEVTAELESLDQELALLQESA